MGCWFETIMLVEYLGSFNNLSLPLVKTNNMNYFCLGIVKVRGKAWQKLRVCAENIAVCFYFSPSKWLTHLINFKSVEF